MMEMQLYFAPAKYQGEKLGFQFIVETLTIILLKQNAFQCNKVQDW